MKKTLSIVAATAFAIAAISAPAMAGPADAIKQNIDENGAFSYCNSSAITNGHVVFGGNSAINPLAGKASQNANTEQSAIDDPQTGEACGLDDSQRVEPTAFWD